MTAKKLHDGLKDGSIKLIHLSKWENVLMPRGSMKKESIGVYILERLKGSYEGWTDPEYGDNPSEADLMLQLHKNLVSEAAEAWGEFVQWVEERKKPK